MPFDLAVDNQSATAGVSSAFDSFWLFADFSVEGGTNLVRIRGVYCATLFSQLSSYATQTGRIDTSAAGSVLSISDGVGNTFDLRGADLLARRLVETGTGIDHLQVFDLWPDPNDRSHLHDLFTGSGWTPHFAEPAAQVTKSRPRWLRTLSLSPPPGAPAEIIDSRHVEQLVSVESYQGTDTIWTLTPFVNNPIFGHLLGLDQHPISDLTIQTPADPAWTQFGQHDLLPGGAEVRGFVMAARGAIEAILSTDLSWWALGGTDGRAMCDRLADALGLGTTRDPGGTDESATARVGGGVGIEALYLQGLTSGNRTVAPIPFHGA